MEGRRRGECLGVGGWIYLFKGPNVLSAQLESEKANLGEMFNPRSALISLLAFQLLNILVATSAHSQAEPFYKGKQIRIVTGATAGGFYDRWARLLARAMPKYLPGQPDIIVQNMPGGGSLVAANYVYGVAKPDGLTMVMPNSNVYLEQLSGHKEAIRLTQVPDHRLSGKNYMLLYMRADAPYKTIGDIIKAKEPPKCGSTGVGSAGYILDRVLEVALGAKINTVMGYPGGNEIDLAVEKGEVHCRGNTILPHFGREPFDTWHKKGFDRHLIQTARKRDPVVAEAPTIYELMDQSKRRSRIGVLPMFCSAAPSLAASCWLRLERLSDRVKMLGKLTQSR